jgi:spermidine synthase
MHIVSAADPAQSHATTEIEFINGPAEHENAFRAIVREYLAITLQEIGLRGAARYLRARRPRRGDATIHPLKSEQVAIPQCSGAAAGPNAGNASAPSPAADSSDAEALQPGSAACETDPFIVDTETERHLQFSGDALQSRMRLDQPYALIAAYTRQMMSFLLFNPDPVHVLMIGLGGGSMAKFCYQHLPRAQITVVEIDERVIALRDSFYVPADDGRFRVIHDDGARYISQLDGPVDVILIDAFDETGVAQSLATSNFFCEASRHLTGDGVLIMNLHGKPHLYATHVERVRAAFSNRALLAPVTANDNVLLFAFKADVESTMARQLDLRARYLQSRFLLQFPSYLQRLRDGRLVERTTGS